MPSTHLSRDRTNTHTYLLTLTSDWTEKVPHKSNRKQTFIIEGSCFFCFFLFCLAQLVFRIISFRKTGKYLCRKWRCWATFEPRMLQLCGMCCRPMIHLKTTFFTLHLKGNVERGKKSDWVITLYWSSGLCEALSEWLIFVTVFSDCVSKWNINYNAICEVLYHILQYAESLHLF